MRCANADEFRYHLIVPNQIDGGSLGLGSLLNPGRLHGVPFTHYFLLLLHLLLVSVVLVESSTASPAEHARFDHLFQQGVGPVPGLSGGLIEY